MMASSTRTTIMARLGECRSRILIGLVGSNTSAARMRAHRPVIRVVLADQRDRVGTDGPGDAADVPARVEVAAAGSEVALLDVPDDRLPDPGLLADLA